MRMLLHWDEVEATATSSAVSRRRLDGRTASLVEVRIKAGTRAERHSHPFEQFVQVISGAGTLETAEGRGRFTAGSIFHFPPDAWHEAQFDEDTLLVETNIAAP